jgi:hypothetical protein
MRGMLSFIGELAAARFGKEVSIEAGIQSVIGEGGCLQFRREQIGKRADT